VIVGTVSLFTISLLWALTVSPILGQSGLEKTEPKLLTDPFLQLPTEDSVRIVWFTEFAGQKHFITYDDKLDQQIRNYCFHYFGSG
jgi:hypothetical protein